MKLSVTIPVYNSARYLERCLKSVVSDVPSGSEIILVDDGSTDGSGELCDRLALEYASPQCVFRTVHKENGGLSSARNAGIELSEGDYLTFVDSDDEIAAGSLSVNTEYLAEHPETDMLEYPIHVHYGSSRSYMVSFNENLLSDSNGQLFQKWMESGGNSHSYACNKIYRRELFNSIRFPEGETFEDLAVAPAIIRMCRTVFYSGNGFYLYHDNTDGITAHYSFRNQEPLFRHNLELLEEIRHISGLENAYCRQWSLCLNLLTDLSRCMDTDMQYIGESARRLRLLKPGIGRTLAMFKAAGFASTAKFCSASLIGIVPICRITGMKKLPL